MPLTHYRRVLLLTLALILLAGPVRLPAVPADALRRHRAAPEALAAHVENVILLKLKASTAVSAASSAGTSGQPAASTAAQTSPAADPVRAGSLGRLHQRWGATSIAPVFQDFGRTRQRLQSLAGKTPARLSSVERRLLTRQKRAPKGVAVPRLENVYRLKLTPPPGGGTLAQALAAYLANPAVDYAEPDTIISVNTATSPNDPCFAQQWALQNTGQLYPASNKYTSPPGTPGADIGAPAAWAAATGGAGVVVAVVDTGLDLAHRDLAGQLWTNPAEAAGAPGVDDDANGLVDDLHGADFCTLEHTPGPEPLDDNGHGTHVAGIIAARSGNGLDMAGVAGQCRLLAVKYANSHGEGSAEDAARALRYAVDEGADVISCSWGNSIRTLVVADTVAYALSQGAIVVAAAGNNNLNGAALFLIQWP